MRFSLCGWEIRPVIAILSWNHLLVGPESLQDSVHARSRAVSFQGLDRSFPVHGVVWLPARSCAICSYITVIPISLPSRIPWRTSRKWILDLRQVSMSASTTFQRVSSISMSRVFVGPLGMMTRTVHPNSCGISPVLHMCWTMATRNIQWSTCKGYLISPQGIPPAATDWIALHRGGCVRLT